MVQVPLVKVPVRAEVWDEARDKAKGGWADLLRQGQAEIAYARAAAQQSLILSDSLAIKEAVQNVVQK
jgi:hypothetical protein